MNSGNLFENITPTLPDEAIEILATGSGTIKIERIVSRGHVSPPDFWYDQESSEWVSLLAGSAVLEFKDAEDREFRPGDWIEIPPHTVHRVKQTSTTEDTIWLAIHWE